MCLTYRPRFHTLADMSKRVALGKAIKAIREAKGLSGSRVATDCLMSHSHLLNIESGHRNATQEAIPLIAAALGVDMDAISYEVAVETKAAA
jgi:transcriptional regulator with XRE-family HTH domain